jgi:glycine/D-amino acid oxidase-like deaminating enzyme
MIGGITGEDRMVRDLGPDYADMVWDIGYRGHVGIIVNRVPLLGRIKPNVLYAMGYSGHGVNVSHAAGEIMADAVAGTFERLDVFEKISHFKIPLGQRLCGQLVALGMLYYRMKDLL